MASKKSSKSAAARTDDDRTRVFPAFPPSAGSRAAFAESWWGRAWIEALETTSMDAGRLSRGRTYARRGAVDQITVTPGLAKAKVHGSAPRPYSSSMRVKQLSGTDWERFLDTVADRAAHLAALLDRDMPPELVQDARAAGVRLLPGVGDLEPDCSCPDWGWPCKHASALCYQIARLLDVDPFVLLLLRGRGETELMTELQARNTRAAAIHATAAATGEAKPQTSITTAPAPALGVPAAEAFATAPDLAAITIFELAPTPARPELPPVLAASAKNREIDQDGLEIVAADTAHRAHALLGAYTRAALPAEIPILPRQSTWQDAIRAVATRPGDTTLFTKIAILYDLEDDELETAVQAWDQGGRTGLETLEEPWTPTTADKARAHAALEEYATDEDPPPLRLWRNRWTAEPEGVQLRLGTDHRWYPYLRDDTTGRWRPHGPAEHDPAAALAGLMAAADDRSRTGNPPSSRR